jgi:acyl-CoA thioester hydrolase
MARIKLQLPEKFVFETTIKVQIGDINYGGHMSNDAYLKLAHEARIRFLETQGWSEKDVDGLCTYHERCRHSVSK